MSQKVLLLDNNLGICESFKANMERYDIDIDFVTSYYDAMKIVNVKYDAIIVDIILDNGKTGLDFAIEYCNVFMDARVLVITGQDEFAKREREGYGVKVEKVFVKPFKENDYKEISLLIKSVPNREREDIIRLIELIEKNIKNSESTNEQLILQFKQLKIDLQSDFVNQLLMKIIALNTAMIGLIIAFIKILT